MPRGGTVEVPLEVASLHRCRYKFPYTKAERLLGYVPVVPLEEGLTRTIRAQRLAGYAVDPRFTLRAPAPAVPSAELRQEMRDREIV